MTAESLKDGLKIQKEIMGDAFPQAAMDNTTPLTRAYQELLVSFTFGEVWKRDTFSRAERSLVTVLGREPTVEEIAEVLTDVDPGEVQALKRSARVPISLEKPVGEEEGAEFGHFIADEQAESPYEQSLAILAKEALREALENLSFRERRVLELRYGLDGEQPRTLDEVGRTFNVTRERIRQIENRSLNKLQHLPVSQQLRNDADINSGFLPRVPR